MNTIEQARDTAECLRALTRNRNDGSAYPLAADTIDALVAEVERLTKNENLQMLRAIKAEAERDVLKADAERLNWFDKQGYTYGFEDAHEGNQWEIRGPFGSIRVAIDAMKGKS